MNIAEFASAIGVSAATVSNAITGRGRISPATREMVLRKMKELDYVPSSNARRLISGRSSLIGLWDTADEIGPFTHEVTRVLLRHLTPRDYDLLYHRGGFAEEARLAVARRIRSRVTDGTIVLGYRLVEDLIRELASPRHPFVGIDVDYAPDPPIPHMGLISIDPRPGLREVAQLLLRQGHRRIGYVYERFRDAVADVFKEELEAVGLTLDAADIVGHGYDPDNGAQAFAEFMSKQHPPTAVLFRGNTLAQGALYQAALMGIRVPEDVSIVGHDDLPLLALARERLTSVRIDVEVIGGFVENAMFELLADPFASIPTKHVHGTLIERRTVGPAPKR